MKSNIKFLSQNITSKTKGIIWLTDEDINYSSPGFYEFNYLLDGILLKSFEHHQDKTQKQNFFLGESFGSPLFIGHICYQDKSDLKTVENHFQLANSFLTENDLILVFNKSLNTAKVNILKDLSAKYSQFEFKLLNL